MSITAKQLLEDYRSNPRNIAVIFDTQEVPEAKDKTGRLLHRAQTMKHREALINTVFSYGEDNIHIAFVYSNGAKDATYVHDSFSFSLMEGAEAEALHSVWEQSQIEKLHQNLGHGGSVGILAEFFIADKDGKCIPASTFIGKTPQKSSGHYGDATIKSNGIAASYQTTTNGCLAWTIDGVAMGMKYLLADAVSVNPDAYIVPSSIIAVEPDDKEIVNDCKNAYGLKLNAPVGLPFRAAQTGMQFAFQDLIGLPDERTNSIVKTLDATLGVACVSLLASVNHADRTKLGGFPGDYRMRDSKEKSLEYRALGNGWLYHPMIANLVFDFARKCAVFAQKGFGKFWKASEAEVISCMMENDVQKAREILERNKELMMKLFQAAWPICNNGSKDDYYLKSYNFSGEDARKTIYNIFYNGAHTAITDIDKLVPNWSLDGKWVTHSEGDSKNVWRAIGSIITGAKNFK